MSHACQPVVNSTSEAGGSLNLMQFRPPCWHQLRLPEGARPDCPAIHFSEQLFAMSGIPRPRLCHIGTKRARGVIHTKPRGGWHALSSEGDVAAGAHAATGNVGGTEAGRRGDHFFLGFHFFFALNLRLTAFLASQIGPRACAEKAISRDCEDKQGCLQQERLVAVQSMAG